MKYLLDTHALLWAAEADPRLGAEAHAVLNHCSSGEAAISALSLLEVAMLNQKGRIELSESIHQYLKELENHYPVLPLQAPIAAEAFQLDLPQADPFDRVIVATARYHRLPLITRDAEITVSGLVEVIW